MNNKELAEKAKWIATDLKSIYVSGGIGQPLWDSNKNYLINQYQYNADRAAMIRACSADTFAFDCVCLVKSILWGFAGDTSQIYGGAVYASNGVPDISENSMMNACTVQSSDFSNVPIGAYLWLDGHAGIYIGNGLGVECTPAWENKVQITAVGNIGNVSGYNTRTWSKWGKLPYIEYEEEPEFHKGDEVMVVEGAPIYGSSAHFAHWVYEKPMVVYEEPYGDRAVISYNSAIIGAVSTANLIPYTAPVVEEEPEVEEPVVEPEVEDEQDSTEDETEVTPVADDTQKNLFQLIIKLIMQIINLLFKKQ